MSVAIRPLTAADRAAWLAMRTVLYAEEAGDDPAGLADDIDKMLASDAWAAFGAEADHSLVGFIELFERPYAEGCSSSPVPFVEGLWVASSYRRQGVGRQLVEAGIAWGRARGRTEIASDTQLWNVRSQRVHRALGFAEAERTVAFSMLIPPR